MRTVFLFVRLCVFTLFFYIFEMRLTGGSPPQTRPCVGAIRLSSLIFSSLPFSLLCFLASNKKGKELQMPRHQEQKLEGKKESAKNRNECGVGHGEKIRGQEWGENQKKK